MGVSGKDVVLKAIRLERTERPPVALLSAGVWTFNRQGISLEGALSMGPQQAAEIIIRTNEEVKSDIIWPGSGYHNIVVRGLGGKIKFRARGAPDVQEPLLKDAADAEKIDLSRLENDQGIRTLWQMACHVVKAVGEKTLVGSSQWGPFTLAGMVYGVEKLMRGIYKDQQAVHEVLNFTSELCCRYLEPYVEAGCGIISIAEPTSSGDMISRGQFERFSLPYLKKVAGRIKQKGALVTVHICGNITNRLDLIPESGADILSVDYKVDLGKVRSRIGGRIAFAGNMNPVAVMQNAAPDEVKAACRLCLEQAGAGSGYVLMPGCDIPPGAPLENIRAMVQAAHSWREEEA
ncbi:MAG: uroporphyrinogen decarboxylase family protein [Eubacteriales bacterium]|jgi:uroporphyrinogen decarboxylase